MMGFLRALKGTDGSPTSIEIKIKKLAEATDVDAHVYP
jgi:hypothetical protein